LSEGYEVIDTQDPEQALGLALEHKPDAILLDLMMPKFSGFELCQSFRSLSYTSTIPILVITGETGAKYKDHCANLGAVADFEKPLKLNELRSRLTVELQSKRSEQRAHVRVRMRLALRLRGTDASGKAFEEITTSENVSAEGFMCNCMSSLIKDAIVEVILSSGGEHYAGRARVVRGILRHSLAAVWLPVRGEDARLALTVEERHFALVKPIFATPAELPTKPYLNNP
jgi:DNA-binding response OmpR family regulator